MTLDYRSGFFTVVGRPNVGKSTLINSLVGQKVTITSARPQTTRNAVRGVLSLAGMQVVFLDTPGIHKPRDKMGSYLVQTALQTLKEVDGILFVVDGEFSPGSGDAYIARLLKPLASQVIIVVNKEDRMSGPKEIIGDRYQALIPEADLVTVSALKGTNLTDLFEMISVRLPAGPQYFPADMVTDQPEQMLVAEIIREKALQATWDEVPHSLAVEVDRMELCSQKDIVDIYAIIYTERESQKIMVIGKNGSLLKKIGMEAREEIEALLGNKVFLDLWVKVKKRWRDREEELRRLGYK